MWRRDFTELFGGLHPIREKTESVVDPDALLRFADNITRRVENLEKAVYACDSSALKEPITAKDIDRWRRVEKAAEGVAEMMDRNEYKNAGKWSPELVVLRGVLR